MKPIISLQSDFQDYYDEHFPKEGDTVFERLTTHELPRKDIYTFLTKHKFVSPLYDKPKKFLKVLKMDQVVISFSNSNRHDGGEKQVMSYKEALKHYGDKGMAVYSNSNKGETFRYLKIGKEAFFMKMKSETDWNSNVDTIYSDHERVAKEDDLKFKPIDAPLYAVDFVYFTNPKGRDHMIAIDINFAPKLSGTGLEAIVSGEEVASLISEWFEEKGTKKKGFFKK